MKASFELVILLWSVCGQIEDTDSTPKKMLEHRKEWWIVMRLQSMEYGVQR